MKRMCIFGRSLAVLLAALLLTLCGSCGKRNPKSIVGGSELTANTRQSILNGRPVPPLESLLAELDALQKPTSVDPQLWSSMKAELHDRQHAGLIRAAYPTRLRKSRVDRMMRPKA